MKRKNLLIVLGILIGICVLIGGSYAIWRLTVSQTGQNRILVSCLNLTLTKEENVINLENAYPIYDEEGRTLTPYSFTITNTCDIFASFVVQLEMTSHSTLPTQYIRAMVNNDQILNLNEYEESTEYVDSDTTEARILARGALGEGDSEDYTLRLWIDSDVDQFTTDAIGKTLSAKITITAAPSTYSPVENGITTLHDAILANEYQTSNIEVAKEKIASKQQPDFTKTAPIIDWQENSTTISGTLSYVMPDPADVGSGKDYASNLTSTNVYVGVATSYTFNSEEGRYYLEDMIYQDPSTIDFSSGEYYVCGAGTNVTSANRLSPYNNTNCTTMYKISGYTGSASVTVSGPDGTSYPATRYSFTRSRTYNQTELESDKSDKGLYAMNDADGTSYYYRGSVRNNYVQFAGFYWRIIRINGDGSIRLLYAGTTKDATGTNAQIGTRQFNSQRNLPLYVGYMYGNTSGSTTEEVNANTNNSTIKSYLDSWYSTNLSEYASYIADSGFCNDRTLSTRSNNGNGVQTNVTAYYAAYDRYYTNYNPSLVCPNAKNDLFTVSETDGNQALTYPIGLITIDELMLAGARNEYVNKLYYPFSGYTYWTMSPGNFDSGSATAHEFGLSSDGVANNTWVASAYGVRPVINLRSDVQISGGIGTQNEPFVVKTS